MSPSVVGDMGGLAADVASQRGASTTGTWKDTDYTVTAEWLELRGTGEVAAEIFSVAYLADVSRLERPVTFVFNGGPGASSAYLHIGLAGPRRVELLPDGSAPPLPSRLIHNEESWLAFTDLVFVDPVDTGFSRAIASVDDANKVEVDPQEYFGTLRDLETLCEFMRRWLSEKGRWGSPVFIAGESYGGYRAARLARMAQEKIGIGLNGTILISPALEPYLLATRLGWGDYEVVPWIDLLPTMALAAAHHGRSRAFSRGAPVDEVRREAETFATGDYATFLTRGASMSAEDRRRVIERSAELTGLDPALVERAEGRVSAQQFARELCRDEGSVLGLYDATLAAQDPFCDREPFDGADPSLTAMGPVYTAAVNLLLRSEIGVRTPRDYKLFNREVNEAWTSEGTSRYYQPTPGATDDLRYGMAMNPHMKVFLAHGWHDLATPYYASDRLRNLMRLDPSVAGRMTVRHFHGGHMFYALNESRRAFSAAIAEFVAESTSPDVREGVLRQRGRPIGSVVVESQGTRFGTLDLLDNAVVE